MELISIPYSIALLAVLVVLLMNLNRLADLFPQLVDCLFRWKGNVSMEHSLNIARQRNFTFIILSVPAILIIWRYGLYSGSFLFCAAAWCGFLLLRLAMYEAAAPRKLDREYRMAARRGLYSAAIPLIALMLVTSGLWAAAGWSDETAKTAFFAEMILFYSVHIIHSFRILHYGYNVFFSFLYLCALEFLPLAALIASEELVGL